MINFDVTSSLGNTGNTGWNLITLLEYMFNTTHKYQVPLIFVS